MAARAPQMTIREVLKLKPVRRLWAAQVVSVFGDFLAVFAVLSYVSFNLHASAAQVLFLITVFGYFRLPQQPAVKAPIPQQQPGD